VAIQFAGHVMLMNKLKNEFDITQAPQEIAGFLYPHGLPNPSKGGAYEEPENLNNFFIYYVK
jgi:hypothetical protein